MNTSAASSFPSQLCCNLHSTISLSVGTYMATIKLGHAPEVKSGMKFLPWVDLRDDHIMIYGWWPLSRFPMSLQSRSRRETSPIVWATHLRNEALDNSFRFDWFVHQDSEDLHLWSVHLRNKSRRSGRLQGWRGLIIFSHEYSVRYLSTYFLVFQSVSLLSQTSIFISGFSPQAKPRPISSASRFSAVVKRGKGLEIFGSFTGIKCGNFMDLLLSKEYP